MPLTLSRQFSYDTQYPPQIQKNDEHGIDFFRSKLDPTGEFQDYLTFESADWRRKNVIDTYQMDSTCINDDLLKGAEKNADGQVHDYQDTCYTRKLDQILENAPTVQNAFKVYRCYKHKFSTAQIDAQSNLEVYISTTLSKSLAYKWCETGAEGERFVICIIIPEGTKGVLPIILGNFKNFNLNEILLHRKGKLYNKHKQIDNMPVYIYHYPISTPPEYLQEYDAMLNLV